ncbi:uncharacterized protein LOC131172941 [Hevea brasiliensis]|uniref:uncharacterized protein LOC131172941 n=1 Tax=Hevea brasiliensis TaxID=3981 RepID=UPI0025DA5C1E|nr:uncharacterized protein LOC131172941 [Hevea brasiliensis]
MRNHATPLSNLNKAYWAIQTLNFDFKATGEKRLLQLNEFDEIRQDAYENAKIFKDKTKRWHDRRIVRKEIKEEDLVLLFNSRLKLFLGKLKSRWSEPFKVMQVFPHGAVEIWSETLGAFKVNGQRLKPYFQGELIEKGANCAFDDLLGRPYPDSQFYKSKEPKAKEERRRQTT